MTLNEARRLFRSLRYYDRLSRSIRDKEIKLAYLIEEYEISVLDGYEIECRSDGFYYRKLPTESYKQLRLPLQGESL